MKAIEQNVHMVPFLLQKVNFQFVDQMPSCDHSNCTILSYASYKRVGFGKEAGKQDTVDYHSKLLCYHYKRLLSKTWNVHSFVFSQCKIKR